MRVVFVVIDVDHSVVQVADCVCLMSLDKTEAVPVDTHVWQFAARHYLPKLNSAKSLSDKLYQEIGKYSQTCL
jgi:N-glycosylase/DNA lyase